MGAAMHADLRATRVPAPSGHRGQRPAGDCRGRSSRAKAGGCGPHLPGLAGCEMETGLRDPARGTAIQAAAAWRCLDHSRLLPLPRQCVTPLAGNGRRLPAIMRPPAGPTGAGNSHVPRGRARVMLGSPAR